jgi:DNA-binding LacI/PurR family transcriptional regulator
VIGARVAIRQDGRVTAKCGGKYERKPAVCCRTMRELGEYLGLHQTTVSLALNNDPRLPEATRRRVREAAVATGYRRDPRVSRLMQHLRATRKRRGAEVIAYVVHSSMVGVLERPSAFRLQWRGAKARAEEQGFGLERFVVGPHHYSAARLNKVIAARAIEAVVVGPMPVQPGARLLEGLDWEAVSAVALNFRFEHPRLHRVASDHPRVMKLALDELAGRGYRRIAYLATREQESGTRGVWPMIYRGWCVGRGAEILQFTVADDGAEVEEAARWFEQVRPDALVGNCDALVQALTARGWKCPGDFGYVRLDWYEGLPLRCSGIDQNHAHAGASAIDLLAACLVRHEFGFRSHPQLQLVDCAWAEGPTTRPHSSQEQAAG